MLFVQQFSSNLPKFMETLKFCALLDHVINFSQYTAICPSVFEKLISNRNNTLLSNHSLLSVTSVFAKLVNNRNNTLVNAYHKGEDYNNLRHYLNDILGQTLIDSTFKANLYQNMVFVRQFSLI